MRRDVTPTVVNAPLWCQQRRGVGSLLTEQALDEMRARGLDLAIVATGGDPGHAPARATYDKAGSTPVPQVWYSKLIG